MNNRLKIISSGVYASVQDEGRFGFKHLGIPESGVMDRYHAQLANLLLGNSKDCPLIEIAFGRFEIEFLAEAWIAITGASDDVLINQEKISTFKAVIVSKGDRLLIPMSNGGVYTYISIRNGFHVPKIMDSCSLMRNVTSKHNLNKGDLLSYHDTSEKHTTSLSKIKKNKKWFDQKEVEVLPGPEFDEAWYEKLTSTYFTISSQSNRQSYLVKEKLPLMKSGKEDMMTSSVMPGTVQLTPSRQLNLLMRDCQTTGGYPRILQLTEMSVSQISQKRPNDTFKFKILL